MLRSRASSGATSMTYESAAEADADRKQHKALRSTRVDLEPIGLTENGRPYRVTYAGETLVEGRRNPIFDACRALLARGITGRLEVWRRGKPSADMQLDIERGAGLAILESATESLRVVSWQPWRPRPDITSQNAVSRRALQPPAAICASPVGFLPRNRRRLGRLLHHRSRQAGKWLLGTSGRPRCRTSRLRAEERRSMTSPTNSDGIVDRETVDRRKPRLAPLSRGRQTSINPGSITMTYSHYSIDRGRRTATFTCFSGADQSRGLRMKRSVVLS
jgi:hypothetical protein